MSAESDSDNPLEPTSSGGYYVPLADLLTGVVFILVILLTAVVITSRPEFETQIEIEVRRDQLQQRLEALKVAERTYIIPRNNARQALIWLLDGLRQDFEALGLSARVDLVHNLIGLDGAALVRSGETLALDRAMINGVARALRKRLACISGGSVPLPAGSDCGGVPPARLARFIVLNLQPTGNAEAVASSAAEVAAIYGGLIAAEPSLARLKDQLARPAMGHGALPDGAERGLRFAFEMEVPPLPPTHWLQEHDR